MFCAAGARRGLSGSGRGSRGSDPQEPREAWLHSRFDVREHYPNHLVCSRSHYQVGRFRRTRQQCGDIREQLRRVAAHDSRPGPNPREPGRPVQKRPALRGGPGNPTIPRRQRQCRRRKSRRARPAVLRAHEIPQLATHRSARALQMLPRHLLVPDHLLRGSRDEEERKPPNSSRPRGNDPRRQNGPEAPVPLPLPSGPQETRSGPRAHGREAPQGIRLAAHGSGYRIDRNPCTDAP